MKHRPLAITCLSTALFLVVSRHASGSAPPAVLEQEIDSLRTRGTIDASGTSVQQSAILAEFYRHRSFAPAWDDPANVRGLLDAIDAAERQGLDPGDYHRDAIRALGDDPRADERAGAGRDLLLSDAFLRLAEDVHYGKLRARAFQPQGNGFPALETPDSLADLDRALAEKNVRGFLERLEPHSAFYEQLRRALESYRRIEQAGGWAQIKAGPSIKPNQSDARMPALRERLAVTGDLASHAPAAEPDRYDAELVAAVQAFQRRHGLEDDGTLGSRTVAAMNVPVSDRIDQLRTSLERARWFLRDLPARYIVVNVAGFRVFYVDNDQVRWSSRVIVGAPYTSTPMFRADMKSIILNPSWSIPDSIIAKEIVPAVRRDPGYLSRKNIRRTGADYVQAPGPGNALGRIKLDLPNPYSIYLHDTPTKSLFERAARTFSHGCIRVENPLELAALVLADPQWDQAALQRESDTGQTRTIALREPVPVLILYWSAAVNPEGGVEFYPDIYKNDAPVMESLDDEEASAVTRPPRSASERVPRDACATSGTCP